MIGERDKPRRLTLPPEEALPRIDAITVNARATWFALLGLLAFVGVTLLGVEDIDFFDASRRTDLPLVGVSVPTLTFFYVAPALTAAVYAYFHFYLMKLWDALAEAPAQVKGRRLGDLVHPWLVTDAALWFRRHEGATADRPLRIVSGFTAGALSWGFGWAVLGYAWWRSHTAHLEWMSLWLLALFVFSLWVGASSLHAAWRRVGHGEMRVRHHGKWPRRAVLAAAVPLAMVSWMRTEGGIEIALVALSDWRAPAREDRFDAYSRRRAVETGPLSTPWLGDPLFGFGRANNPARLLASVDLTEKQIVEKPEGWLERESAEADFRTDWCRRRERPVSACIEPDQDIGGEPDVDDLSSRRAARRGWCELGGIAADRCDAFFEREETSLLADWTIRRAEYLSTLTRPSLRGRDLRGANLVGAFLPGIDIREARIEGADLGQARAEGADFSSARMDGAVLVEAQIEAALFVETRMEGADFSSARLEGADLRRARMERAVFMEARMEGADLRGAWMEGADFRWARLQRADLREARIGRADLSLARMQGADFRDARMEGTDLRGVQMEGADFREARMAAANLGGARMEGADFRGARMEGIDLREAWMKGVDLRGASMVEADLRGARMEEADIRGATLLSVDLSAWENARSNARSAVFSKAENMTQQHVNAMFGDVTTVLPAGLRRTDLMDRAPLERLWDEDPDYKAWLAAGAPPGKPLP